MIWQPQRTFGSRPDNQFKPSTRPAMNQSTAKSSAMSSQSASQSQVSKGTKVTGSGAKQSAGWGDDNINGWGDTGWNSDKWLDEAQGEDLILISL